MSYQPREVGHSRRPVNPPPYRPPLSPPRADPLPDPLTDSAVRRGIGIGTIVRLHLWGESQPVDVPLLDIIGVNTWRDMVGWIRNRYDIETTEPHPSVIHGEAIRWIEQIQQ